MDMHAVEYSIEWALANGLPADYFSPACISLRYYEAQQNKFHEAGIDHRDDIEESDFWR